MLVIASRMSFMSNHGKRVSKNLDHCLKVVVKYIFEKCNINWYNIIIATHTTSPAMLSYIAPYSGTAVAEYLRDNG